MASMISPWSFGSFSPHLSDLASKILYTSHEDPKSRSWTLRRYPSLRSPESVLPKPMEILADAEKYTSFRGMKDTLGILAAFGFLKTMERSSNLVDRLPVFGNVSIIMKRLMASCLPYLAEEIKSESHNVKSEKQLITTRDFDGIFPMLMDDLVGHAKEYGVPKDTLDWYQNVSVSSVGQISRLMLTAIVTQA